MRAAFALANVKRHAPVTRAHAISCTGGAHKWRRIHVSRPQLEGNVRHDGQSGGRERCRQGTALGAPVPLSCDRKACEKNIPSRVEKHSQLEKYLGTVA